MFSGTNSRLTDIVLLFHRRLPNTVSNTSITTTSYNAAPIAANVGFTYRF